MADGSMSKQGDILARRQSDQSTLDLAQVACPSNVGGAQTSLTGDAAAVTVGVDTACVMVLVQADPTNTVNVSLGGSAAQPIQLAPGQSMLLPISNVNKLYVKSVGANTKVNYLIFA